MSLGSYVDVSGDMLKRFSLNSYAGKNVIFALSGDTQNCSVSYGVYDYTY
jgi:hypothetical protein